MRTTSTTGTHRSIAASEIAPFATLIATFLAIAVGLLPGSAYADEASGTQSTAVGSGALTAATVDLGTQDLADDAALSTEASLTPTSVSNAWQHDYFYNWATLATSHLHVNGNELERVQFTGDELVVETVSADFKSITSQKTIPASTYQPSNLSLGSACIWGGFFSGEANNYVVTGQANPNEDNNLVVFRITKYTKDWEYVAAAEIRGANTTTPFDGGSCDMTELDGSLYIRTCHEMYRSNDGVIHQANVQFVIDESDMTVIWQATGVSNYSTGYVSHSFNQFLTVLSGSVFGLDHGDAYPRAIAIKNLSGYGGSIGVMQFPGDVGDNMTGATVGGFEASASTDNVLVVGSRNSDESINWGIPRNVWIVTAPSDLSTSTIRNITSYSTESAEWAGNPFLVKVSDDRLLVLWGIESLDGYTGTIAYQFVDGNGNPLTSTKTVEGMLSDCEPVVYNGKIVWYEGNGGEPGYYAIDASTGEFSKYETLGCATMTVEGTDDFWYDSKTGEYVNALPYMYARTCPDTTLTLGMSTLVEGVDYTIDYQIDRGKAQGTVTAIGKGRFAGQSRSKTFDIMVVDMDECYFEGVEDKTYTGSPVVQDETELLYFYSDVGLTEGVDYTVAYSNNVNAGTAHYVVTGLGLVSGTIKGEFEIEPAPIYDAEVSPIADVVYDGKPHKPVPTVKLANRTLKQGTDYTISYYDNVNVGYATVSIAGKGNYGGTKDVSFKITRSKKTDDGKGVSSCVRLWGNTALDTMSAIVDEGVFPKGGAVVLATAEGYWDALTAAGIAGLADAPVLMTDGKSLSAQTRAQIAKLKPKTIVICGGTAAVSRAVESQARSAAGGAAVVRCAGQTATGTAVKIFENGRSFGVWSDTAFVCTNDGYWDALAAAPVSYARRMPIFLTEGRGSISAESIRAMQRGGIRYAYIVGGEAAISPAVKAQLDRANVKVLGRLWGDTAIETSEAVAEFGLGLGLGADGMGLATTAGYWDALAGAALCGRNGSVLTLADGPYAHSVSGFMARHRDEISDFYIFGGTAAVSRATENAAVRAAK